MLLSKMAGPTPCPCCAYGHAQSVLPFAPFRSLTKLVTGISTAPAKAQAAPIQPSALRLAGVTIVDPRTGKQQPGMTVAISHGRISDIFPTGSKEALPHAEVIDARGKYLVPGYNDMHSHVLELTDPSGSLALMLAEGTTGFRQMSGSPALLAARRAGQLPMGPAAPALHEAPVRSLRRSMQPPRKSLPKKSFVRNAKAPISSRWPSLLRTCSLPPSRPPAFKASRSSVTCRRGPILSKPQRPVSARSSTSGRAIRYGSSAQTAKRNCGRKLTGAR